MRRRRRRAGIKPLAVVPGEFTRDGGDEAAQQVTASLRDHEPGLTTVALPLQEMGRRAIEMALAPDTGEQSVTRIGGKVIMRASTKPAPGRGEP